MTTRIPRRRLFTIAAILAVILSASFADAGAILDVSGNRAHEHVVALSTNIGSRPAGSANSLKAANYIARQFSLYGYAPEFQEFSGASVWNNAKISDRNVIATLRGKDVTRMFVAGAHYDSVADSPGANDNASGVGVLLELARALAVSEPAITIVFVAFGAEEDGLIGSYAFVKAKTSGRIIGMINLDVIGVAMSGEALWVANSKGDNFLTRLAVEHAKRLGIAISRESSEQSDHVAFEEAGIPALFLNRPDDEIHTPNDTADRVLPALLEDVAKLALAVIREVIK